MPVASPEPSGLPSKTQRSRNWKSPETENSMARPNRSRSLAPRRPAKKLFAEGIPSASIRLPRSDSASPETPRPVSHLPSEVARQAQREMDRLRRLPQGSPEAGQVRAYL